MQMDTANYFHDLAYVQLQFATIYKTLGLLRTIPWPSLEEESGVLSSAQAVLDSRDRELGFLSELLAVSFVRALSQRGLVCIPLSFVEMTNNVANILVRLSLPVVSPLGHLMKQDTSSGESVPVYGVFSVTPEWTKYVDDYTAKTWLPQYGTRFRGLGFRKHHNRLLAAFDRVAGCLPAEDLAPLAIALFQYPLGGPLLKLDVRPREKRDDESSALLSMPIRYGGGIPRLHSLISEIENAPARESRDEWVAYLRERLGDFEDVQEGPFSGRELSSLTHDIWRVAAGGMTAATVAFADLYKQELRPFWVISKSPYIKDDAHVPHLERLPIALESIRQCLLMGEPPVCLCSPAIREACNVKPLMLDAWLLVRPDHDEDEWFEERWRKGRPACLEDDPTPRVYYR